MNKNNETVVNKTLTTEQCDTVGLSATNALLVWVNAVMQKPLDDECVDVYYCFGDYEGRVTDVFFDKARFTWWQWDKKCTAKVDLPTGVTHWMHQPVRPEH